MLYFAYGSNLNKKGMKERCPDSVPVMAYTLRNWRLVFRTHLDIENSVGDVVHGALYRVSARDEMALDRYEGYNPKGWGYYSKQVELVEIDGKTEEIMFYVMTDMTPPTAPSTHYYKVCEQGFRDWNLPLDTLMSALEEAELNSEATRSLRAIEVTLITHNPNPKPRRTHVTHYSPNVKQKGNPLIDSRGIFLPKVESDPFKEIGDLFGEEEEDEFPDYRMFDTNPVR